MRKSNAQIYQQVETIKNKLMALHEDAYQNVPDQARGYLEISKWMDTLSNFQNSLNK